LGAHPEEDAELVEEGRKTTPPSSSSTSRVLGFSAPGFQNLDMAALLSDVWRWRGWAVGEKWGCGRTASEEHPAGRPRV
jgi:hypothetical protein